MNNYEEIIVEKKDKIGFLTLNRPQDDNRMTLNMLDEIISAMHEFEEDDKVRAVVIKAAGKNFCCGISYQALNKKPLEQEVTLRKLEEMRDTVEYFPKGTVTAIQGQTIAAGGGLATRGDIAVMEEDAQIAFAAINVGFACQLSMRFLEPIIGYKKMMEMVLTGEFWSAKDAERFGLINRVAPKGKLMEVAMERADVLASKAPLGVRFTKLTAKRMRNMTRGDAREFATLYNIMLMNTEDGKEGFKALVENRKPVWKGR
jgi:enoyl-CoA hydratase/carnithine racemase